MAALQAAFYPHTYSGDRNTNSLPIVTFKTSLRFCSLTSAQIQPPIPNSAHTYRRVPASLALKHDEGNSTEEEDANAAHVFVKWFELVRDVFPGGSWWDLRDFEQNFDGSSIVAEPVTVWRALGEMWALVADEKWILYAAFGALTVAAVSVLIM